MDVTLTVKAEQLLRRKGGTMAIDFIRPVG
jgi:hypothetical protein